MNAKEILKKFIAGEYFREGDYFTEEQIESFGQFVRNFRELLKDKKNQNYFRETIKSLIFSNNERKVGFATSFGRYYFHDEVICSKLRELTEDPPNNSFRIKVQAIYECLTEKNTDLKNREKWYQFLIRNLGEYKSSFNQTYGIRTIEDKWEYFKRVVEKISKTPDNKRWVYFIELVALKVNIEESKKTITGYLSGEDEFVSKVAKQCLELF